MIGNVTIFEYEDKPAVTWTESRRHYLWFFLPLRSFTRSFVYITGGSSEFGSQIPTLTIQDNNSKRRSLGHFFNFVILLGVFAVVARSYLLYANGSDVLFLKFIQTFYFSVSLSVWGALWNVFLLWFFYDFIYYVYLIIVYLWVEIVFSMEEEISPDYYIEFWGRFPMFYYEDLQLLDGFVKKDSRSYAKQTDSQFSQNNNTVIIEIIFTNHKRLPISSVSYHEEWSELLHDKLNPSFSKQVSQNIIRDFNKKESIKRRNNPNDYQPPKMIEYDKDSAYKEFVDTIAGLSSQAAKRDNSLSFIIRNFSESNTMIGLVYNIVSVIMIYLAMIAWGLWG